MDEKLLKKLKQADFMKKIIDCSTNEEIKEVLEKEGVNATDEEIKEVISEISKLAKSISISKIDDQDMSEVSGGGIVLKARDKLADKIYYAGEQLWYNSSAADKIGREDDYTLKDKAVDKVSDVLFDYNKEIASGIVGSAIAAGTMAAITAGYISCTKIKDWIKNKKLHK